MARRRSSRTGAGTRSAPVPVVRDDSRADYLVVARESARYDHRLMEGMVEQTLARFPDVPGRDELMEAGLGPLIRPAEFGTSPRRQGRKGQWVLFEVSGTHAFYFMGSATSRGEDGENVFSSELCDVLAYLRPRNVMISTFSRLVRSTEFAGKVYGAVLQHVDVLHTDTKAIDLRTAEGRTFWHVLSMFSAMERDSQMMRLTLGQIARYRQGVWLPGRKAVPLGYRLGTDGRVVLDEGARDTVREVLDTLSLPMTAREFVDRLDRLGLATPMQTGAGWAYPGAPDPAQPGMTVGALSQAQVRRRQFENLVGLYRTGEYVYEWEVPVAIGDAVGDVEVHPAEFDEHGMQVRPPYISLPYRLPLPEGGWADGDVLDRAEAARDRDRRQWAGASTDPLPLSRVPLATRHGREHRLVAQAVEARRAHVRPAYRLMERPEELGARPSASGYARPLSGWHHGGIEVGRQVALIDAAALHRSLADGLAEGLTAGGVAERLDGHAGFRAAAARSRREPSDAEQRRRLEQELSAASAETARAAEALLALAQVDLEPEALKGARDKANALSVRERELRNRIARLDAVRRDPRDPGPGFTSEADMLVGVLAGLATTPGRAPRAVADDLAEILTDLAFDYDDDWVTWSARVLVPADGGWVAALGPFTGRVRRRGQLNRTIPAHERGRSLARDLLRDGAGLAELAARDDGSVQAPKDGTPGGDDTAARTTGRRARQRARAWLVGTGMTHGGASVALLCCVPDTRRVLWALAADERLPDGTDPEFAAHLRTLYWTPQPGTNRWWWPPAARQALLDVLAREGGAARRGQIRDALGPQVHKAVPRYATGQGRPGCVLLPERACRNKTSDCGADDCYMHGLVRARPCPHCGPGHHATRWAGTFEVPGSVLCPDCGRAPDQGSPVFPAPYLALDDAAVRAETLRIAPEAVLRGNR